MQTVCLCAMCQVRHPAPYNALPLPSLSSQPPADWTMHPRPCCRPTLTGLLSLLVAADVSLRPGSTAPPPHFPPLYAPAPVLREAARVEALCAAACRSIARCCISKRLHFNEQWSLAFKCWNYNRTRRTWPAVGQEHFAGIGNTNQTKFGHFKQAKFAC